MKCPNCSSENSKTLDSRISETFEGSRRRRRECLDCGKRFTSYEISEKQVVLLLVPKKYHEKIIRQQIESTRIHLSEMEELLEKSGGTSDDNSAFIDSHWSDV